MQKPWKPRVIWALAAMPIVAACGSSASKAPASSSSPATSTSSAPAPAKLQNATIRMDWTPSGYHAVFVYGVKLGIYKKYGINLKVVAGTGSVSTIETTAQGQQDFGLGDGGTLIGLVAKGIKAIMVDGFMQESPNAVLVPKTSGATQPSQLAGKSLAATPGSAALELFPAFEKKVGLAPGSVHLVDMGSSARIGSILSHQTQGEVAFETTDLPLFEAHNLSANTFLFANYGLNVESLGIVVNPNLIKTNPTLIQNFVKATQAAIKATEKNPTAAVQAEIQYFPAGTSPSASVLLRQLQLTFPLMQTPADKGKPLGWMAKSDWQTSQNLVDTYMGVKTKVPLNKLYTDQFTQ